MSNSRQLPIHVGSLSLTYLKTVEDGIKGQPENPIDSQRVKWIHVGMELNRRIQLQNVMQYLGDKANDPKVRILRIKPAFSQWKNQVGRAGWIKMKRMAVKHAVEERIDAKRKKFFDQRCELACRHFAELPSLIPSLNGVMARSTAQKISDFQPPKYSGTIDVDFQYCESSAVTALSQVPESDDEFAQPQAIVEPPSVKEAAPEENAEKASQKVENVHQKVEPQQQKVEETIPQKVEPIDQKEGKNETQNVEESLPQKMEVKPKKNWALILPSVFAALVLIAALLIWIARRQITDIKSSV